MCGVLKNQQDFEELEQKGRLILVTGIKQRREI